MANLFNTDFRDFLEALQKQKVLYVLIGGYSVILHGYNRTTHYNHLIRAKEAAGRLRDLNDIEQLKKSRE